MTLKNGGNVLVPCSPAGVIYDLLECLSGHLDSSGLGQVPMYFISPVADSSLAYSNIYAEWSVPTNLDICDFFSIINKICDVLRSGEWRGEVCVCFTAQ